MEFSCADASMRQKIAGPGPQNQGFSGKREILMGPTGVSKRARVPGENDAAAVELFFRRALKGRHKKPYPDIVSFNKTGTRIPLYLFPSGTLGPTEYLELGKYFDLEQPWHVLFPSFEECKAGPEGLIKEIAIGFADRLDAIQPKGQPMIVGGWCAGVVPALELARQLRARGRDVPLVIAIDGAPENTGIAEGRKRVDYRIMTNIHNSRQQGKNWSRTAVDLVRYVYQGATNKIFRPELEEIDKVIQATPRIPSDDIASVRRFLVACCACPPPEPYDGKVLVIESSYELRRKIKEKWKSFASNVESIVIEGTHDSIVSWKAAAKLAEALNRRLSALSRLHHSF